MAQTAKMKLFCDLDGTLIDVSERNYRVYVETTEQFGGSPLTKDTYWRLKRKKTKWAAMLPKSGLSVDTEERYLLEFIKKIEAPKYLKLDTPFPGVLDTLDELSNAHEVYLVSLRRNRTNLLAELEWLNLMPHFTDILTGHSENDGYDVKIALIRDKIRGEAGYIIGDTEADIVAGKELGLTTIAVMSGIRDRKFLAAFEPDFLLKDINAVRNIDGTNAF